MKRFEIVYKDCTGMKCMVNDILSVSEKEAIINFQLGLMSQDDYMTQLIDIQEISHDNGWSLEDGTPLGKNFQERLNDAMGSYTNSNGLTLEQAMELASQRKNK